MRRDEFGVCYPSVGDIPQERGSLIELFGVARMFGKISSEAVALI